MEEVAEGSKDLVRKLSEDEKLTNTLKQVTENFNAHVHFHTRIQSWRDFFGDAFGQVMGTTSPQPTQHSATSQRDQSDDSTIVEEECKHAVEQSRFRAYNFARKLKQQREELEPGIRIAR